MRTRLKVCCMASAEEVATAVCCGADAVGLVAEMPSGPGPISDALAAELARVVPPGVASFLLSSREDGDALAAHAREVGVAVLQIVRHVDGAEHARIRRAAPGLKIVQVVHVEDEGSVALALRYGESADALLLDSGRPGAAVAELGGTGRAHDWALSRRIVEASRVPVWLAGGLNPGNVGEAIGQVRPFGVDLCSGVRTAGDLDEAKTRAFVAAVAATSTGATEAA